MSTAGRAAGDSVPAQLLGTTDARGTVTFCEVPSGRTVTVTVQHPAGGAVPPQAVVLGAREVRHLELATGPRQPNE
jgi:hypothetical protein